MKVGELQGLQGLQGLNASTRSTNDQRAINQINTGSNTVNTPSVTQKDFKVSAPTRPMGNNMQYLSQVFDRKALMDYSYQDALWNYEQKYHVGKSINSNVREDIKKVASEVSPYFKKYWGTDKIPDDKVDWQKLAAQYQAQRDAYGEEVANNFLNSEIKDVVGQNQRWYEQAWNGLLGVGASTAGALIEFAGAVKGGVDYLTGDYKNDQAYNENLGGWDQFMNSVIDNDWTRYGNDVVQYGAIDLGWLGDNMKNNLQEAKQQGLSNLEIVKTKEQEDAWISSATPWEALQQGGFTTASMLSGWGEAQLAGWFFKGLKYGSAFAKGAKTAEDLMKLRSTLGAIQKAEKVFNTFALPAMAGTSEGLVEALNTKQSVQQSGMEQLNKVMNQEVNDNIQRILQDATFTTDRETGRMTYYDKSGRPIDMQALYQQEYNKLLPKYKESMDQIDFAASKAGINNFYLNSAINGLTFSTLKAGLTAPNVQRALKDSKLTGWMYPKTRFNVNGQVGTSSAEATVREMSNLGKAWHFAKEPLGEFTEEYLQTLSDKAASGGANHNIESFIDNKYNGDGTAAVGDYMSGDMGAAWTAFTGSLTSKEAIQSGIMGAISSVMGSPAGVRRSTDGKWGRGKREDGSMESKWDVFQRWTPWRSGAMSSYNEYKRDQRSLRNDAKVLTDWLRDPDNKDKFDGLTGTMNWAKAMGDAARANDEFSYRNSRLGKTINDAIMLQKLEGTDFYNSIMNNLSKVANLESNSEDAQKVIREMRDDVNNTFDDTTTDEEILKTLKGNANQMLTALDQIQTKSDEIDKRLGYVDKDTRQSLIFGDMLLDDWSRRAEQIDEEIKQFTPSSKRSRRSNLTKEQQEVLAKYGSFANAQKQLYKFQERKSELEEDISNIKKRKNLTDEDERALKDKQDKLKMVNRELKNLDALSTIENEAQTILNEQDIMALDAIPRAIMLHRGKEREYTITHSGQQEYNQMLQDLSTKQAQRRAWIKENGKVKKGHNKQVQKIDAEIADLKAKIQAATSETRAYYSPEQQQAIDDLYIQLGRQNKELFDKLIDRGRIEQSMSKLASRYNELLLDRNAFNVYSYRAKQAAADAASGNRFEALNAIQDYNTFAEEMDKMYDSSTEREQQIITSAMKRHGNANFDRYSEDKTLLSGLFNQVATDEAFKSLDTNDQDMFAHTLQYLTNRGIDLQDSNAVVAELSKQDENGVYEFQKYVDDANSVLPELQRTTFTSIGEAINTFNQVMANYKRDDAEKATNAQPIVAQPTTQEQSAPAAPVNPTPNPAPGIFGQAATSLEEAEKDMQKTNEQQGETPATPSPQPVNPTSQGPITPQGGNAETKTVLERAVDLANNVVRNVSDNYSTASKDIALTALSNIATDVETTPQEYAEAIMAEANRIDAQNDNTLGEEAAALLRQASTKVQGFAEKEEAKEEGTNTNVSTNTKTQSIFDAMRDRAQQRANSANSRDISNAAIMKSSSFDWLRSHHPNNPVVKYWDAHHVEEFLRGDGIKDRRNTPVYFISDSNLATEIKQSIEASGGTYTNEDIPLIAVVEHPKGDIQIGNRHYQVIGTFPSSTPRAFNVMNQDGTTGRQGISNIQKIRNLIDVNNPNGIIQDAQGNVITTTLATIDAQPPLHIPAGNPNLSTIELSLRELNAQEQQELRGLSKTELREHPKYKSLKQRFLSMLQYTPGKNYVEYLMPNLKNGSYPVPVFVTAVSQTRDKNSDRLISELFNTNDVDALLKSNSRLEKAAEILAKLGRQFPNTADTDIVSLDQLADGTLIPTGDFAKTLSAIEAQLNKDMAHHLSLPDNRWKYTITPTDEVIDGGRRMFQLALTDGTNTYIPLGKITNGNITAQTQFNILKNLFIDENNAIRKSGKWDLVKWNVDYPNSTQTIDDVKGGLARAFDDGILDMSKEGLTYTMRGISVNSPFNSNGELRVTPTVANNDNATINTQGPTNVATGAVQKDNTVIDTDTGTPIQGPAPSTQENPKLKRAKEVVKEIEEESEHIKLSEDGRNYIDDRNNNKFARVTSIIAADIESDGRFNPDSGWVTPSTNIGTGVDEFTRDFFAGKIDLFDVYDYDSEEAEAKALGITIDQLKMAGRATHKEWKVKDGTGYKELYDVYPNASGNQWDKFATQLQQFKNSLDAEGITIIPRDVIASGTLEVTDKDGKKHSINVAGTLDLLGYDADGNFIIFDMKTNHSSNINEHKKKKWRRQLSLYQKFLQDKYGITVKETRIIPIKVDYPTPKGERAGGIEGTADYSVEPGTNQLLIDGRAFRDSNPSLMPILNNMGYREADVRYENLTDEEKELIANLEKAFAEGEGTDNSQTIEIQSAEPVAPSEPAIDPITGLPIADDGGGFWDNSMFGGDSFGPVIDIPFVPSRLAWNKFEGFTNDDGESIDVDATMKNLEKYFTEEQWNNMTNQEQEHEIKCKGVFKR